MFGVAALTGFVVFRPNVSVQPILLLNPVNPFSTTFSVKNENQAFAVTNLHPHCTVLSVQNSNDNVMVGSFPDPTIPLLNPGEESTIYCPESFGGVGEQSGKVLSAYIEMEVSYRQNWLPFESVQHFPMKGVTDSQGVVHWTHITREEENRGLYGKR